MRAGRIPALLAVVLLIGLVIVPAASAAGTILEMGNGNTMGTEMSPSGPKAPTTFTFTQTVTLVTINAYHYDAKGQGPPGTLSLRDQNGKLYGPWYTKGSTGQGGVKNAFWSADINVVLPAGTYTVVDSNPATWSYNAKSNYQGFAGVRYTIAGSSGSSPVGHFMWPTAEAFASAVATSALVGAFGFGGALFGAIVGGFTFIPPRGFQYPDRFGGGPTPYDPGYSAGWGKDSDDGSGSPDAGGGSDYSGGDGGGDGESDPGSTDNGGDNAGSGTAPAPSPSGPMYGDGSANNPFRDGNTLGVKGTDGKFTPYAENAGQPTKIFGDGSVGNPYSNTQQPVNDPPPTPPDAPIPPVQPAVLPQQPIKPTGSAGPVTPPVPVPPAGPVPGPGPVPPVQPPAPPVPPVPPQPPEPPQPPGLTPGQRTALVAEKDRYNQVLTEVQAQLAHRNWLINVGIPNAKRVYTLHIGLRAGTKMAIETGKAITDPKGMAIDKVKEKTGLKEPADYLKEKYFGKDVPVTEIVKDAQAAKKKIDELKGELDTLPSGEELESHIRALKYQIGVVDKKLGGGD